MNKRAIDRSVKVPTLHVAITQANIDDACRRNANKCMIANAIQAAYPHLRRIVVTINEIGVTDPKAGYRYRYMQPAKNTRALINYDLGKKIRPYEFTVTGAQAVPASPLARTRTVKHRKASPKDRTSIGRIYGGDDSIGEIIKVRPAGDRDPRPRSGDHLPKGHPNKQQQKRFTVVRKFGVCALQA